MKSPEWFKELRPHFTFYLITILLGALGIDAALSSGLSWVFRTIQASMGAPAMPPHFYFVLGCLIFSAILLSAIFAFVLAGYLRRNTPPVFLTAPPLSPPQQNVTVLPKTIEDPKLVDLRGDIRETYLAQFDTLMHGSRTYLVLNVHIVNHGPDTATIIGCGVRASLGSFRADGTVLDSIPDSWRIKKMRKGVVLGVVYDEHLIEPLLGVKGHEEIYTKGIPHEGWLAFEFTLWGHMEFPNAQIELFLLDSLKGSHTIVRPAGVYSKEGELIQASQPALPPKP